MSKMDPPQVDVLLILAHLLHPDYTLASWTLKGLPKQQHLQHQQDSWQLRNQRDICGVQIHNSQGIKEINIRAYPPLSSTWRSMRIDHANFPESTQSDSASIALLSLQKHFKRKTSAYTCKIKGESATKLGNTKVLITKMWNHQIGLLYVCWTHHAI